MQASPNTHQTAPGLWLAQPPAPPLHQAAHRGPSPSAPLRVPGAAAGCQEHPAALGSARAVAAQTPLGWALPFSPPRLPCRWGGCWCARAFGSAVGGPPILLPTPWWEVEGGRAQYPVTGAPRWMQSPVSGANPHPLGLRCVRMGPQLQLPPAPAGLGLPRAGGSLAPVPPSRLQHPWTAGPLPC